MAQRRMVSLKIVDTDAFMDMPLSSQALYLHLLIRADDDGFIANPKKVMRMVGCQDDDFKVLATKRFILPFESGVCVIKHWRIHNLIRADRYSETQWVKEKEQLKIDPQTKKYSLTKGDNINVIPNGNQRDTQVRLGKVRIGKRENKISFLKELQNEDIQEVRKEYGLSEKIIKDMAESIILYCESKPKRYANYKAALKNWLRREYKEEIEKFRSEGGKKIKEWKQITREDGSIAMKPIYE